MRLGWLRGEISGRAEGPGRADFLNRCAALGVQLWTMAPVGGDALLVRAPARQAPLLRRAAEESGCVLTGLRLRGLPPLLRGFRRRYALAAGMLLCLGVLAVGSHVVLDIRVEGNRTISDRAILCQLRLLGVEPGVYAPSVRVREVENGMLRSLDTLSFCSLTFRGTRAVVRVREAQPPPEDHRPEGPADIVAAADGVILHMEPYAGDARFREGDGVLAGEVLISGTMTLDSPAPGAESLGTMTVRAEGRVMAQTRRTLTAGIRLDARRKVYTGESLTRYSLSLLGRRVNFYENSSIPYAMYDTMTQKASWSPWGDRGLPVVWEKEVARAYRTVPLALDPGRAEAMLKDRLTRLLPALLEEGEVLETAFETRREGEDLQVTLRARCTEQIGRARALEPPRGTEPTGDIQTE